VFTGITGWWVARNQVLLAFPDLAGFPELSGVALLGAAVALGGALCSPPPSVPYAAARPLRQEAAA
jgi:energy-coupling factor transport system permease protein